MPRANLQEVGRKAIEDPAFFRALMKDPEKALRDAALTLSPGALQQIKTIVRKNRAHVEVHLYELVTAIHLQKIQAWPMWGAVWMSPAPDRIPRARKRPLIPR